jgi:hypothetical protein
LIGLSQAQTTNITYHNASSDPYKGALDKFNAFDQGFQGDNITANFSNCAHKYILLTKKESGTFKMKLNYGSWQESVFNTTMFLKNSSYSVSYCTDTVHGFYEYVLYQ